MLGAQSLGERVSVVSCPAPNRRSWQRHLQRPTAQRLRCGDPAEVHGRPTPERWPGTATAAPRGVQVTGSAPGRCGAPLGDRLSPRPLCRASRGGQFTGSAPGRRGEPPGHWLGPRPPCGASRGAQCTASAPGHCGEGSLPQEACQQKPLLLGLFREKEPVEYIYIYI